MRCGLFFPDQIPATPPHKTTTKMYKSRKMISRKFPKQMRSLLLNSSIYYFQLISDHNSSSKRSKNTPKNYICSAYYNAKYHMTCEFVYSSKGLIWKGGKNILGVKKRCRDLVTYAYILITYWLKMFELVFSQSTFLGTGRIQLLFRLELHCFRSLNKVAMPQNLKKI